jgi:hypothetical protein
MRYNTVINSIAIELQNRARVFTRYNYATAEERLSYNADNSAIFQKLSTKFVVVEYRDAADSEVSAHIKITQFGNKTVVPTKEMLLEQIGSRNQSFFQIDPKEHIVSTSRYAAAVKQAGLGGSSHAPFVRLLRDLDNMIRGKLEHGRTDILVGASELLHHECVMLFVQLSDMAMVIEISE